MTLIEQSFNLQKPESLPSDWLLAPETVFLNHGSFGACPREVFAFQQSVREHLERQPVQFFVRELEAQLDASRKTLAHFLNAPPQNVVFVPNATHGVNTVLRSLSFRPGDELLVTNHEYNACRNALDFVAEQTGARVVVVCIPFPLSNPEQAMAMILEAVSSRTRLALLDHVSSQTGLVFPIERLAPALTRQGVEVLVDGAHAPGMVPLNLAELGATYYTGNCHKWICAPKGAAFLYVDTDRQASIRPLSISHGANSPRRDRSRYLIEFGWMGTWDPSAYLSVPAALRWMQSQLPGGWPEIMARNRALALAGRRHLCQALQIPLPCPDEMIGSLASVPLPNSTESSLSQSPLYSDPLQDKLRASFGIEVPIIPWPAPPERVLRISAQLYNSLPQYELLAGALTELLGC